LARAATIAAAIARQGVPNFFGPQSFGLEGANIAKGRLAWLGQGPRGDKWLNRLLISAYQSHLFNGYLARRMDLGLFDRLLAGDVCKKADTGGMFDVQDAAAEQPRYERGEITFTGPIYGKKMWAAKGEAAELEAQVLVDAALTEDDLRKSHVDGTRRPARLWLPAIDLALQDQDLQVEFALPKGAYATVVLREFMKSDEGADQFADSPDE
jgi:tRNA pseudouridine13 synthase